MSLTAISSLESGRRKYFRNSTYILSRKQESNVFFAQDAKMSLIAKTSLESATRKFVINSTYIMSRNYESTFWGSGGQNESNNHQLATIGEKKIFHQLDVNHVQKEGIKRFWAQEAKMSLTAISSLESAIPRRKFFRNSTYILSRKQESNVFGLRRPK